MVCTRGPIDQISAKQCRPETEKHTEAPNCRSKGTEPTNYGHKAALLHLFLTVGCTPSGCLQEPLFSGRFGDSLCDLEDHCRWSAGQRRTLGQNPNIQSLRFPAPEIIALTVLATDTSKIGYLDPLAIDYTHHPRMTRKEGLPQPSEASTNMMV